MRNRLRPLAGLAVLVMVLAGCDFSPPGATSDTPDTITSVDDDAGQDTGDEAAQADAGEEAAQADDDQADAGGTSGDEDAGEDETGGQDAGAVTTDGKDADAPDRDAPGDPPEDSDTTAPAPAANPAPAAMSGDMIVPDVSGGLPEGSAGSSEKLIVPKDRPNGRQNGNAAFRTTCEFSHMNFDDPIVFPGQPGASHLHVYFGNTDVDAMSTAESIANSGNSTCRGGIANRSAYWAPALLDAETRRPVEPRESFFYYKRGFYGVQGEAVQPMPEGLRIVAGNARATSPSENDRIEWVCLANASLGGTKDGGPTIPTDCREGDVLRMIVEFPQCWDGERLDAPDHISHMAYAKNGCPDSHPVPLPIITVNVDYDVDDAAAVSRWRLSSDAYDRSERGGASAHADWFNGWDREVVNTFLDACFRPPRNCGTNNLGNGTGLGRP